MKSERAGENLITDVCHTMKSDRDEKKSISAVYNGYNEE